MGLDFGTGSARCVIVRLEDGGEIASGQFEYPSGVGGVITDSSEPELARQNPLDYEAALARLLPSVIAEAGAIKDFSAENIVGIGVDTTASTCIPLDENMRPLDTDSKDAQAWLWKDHTSFSEAAEITDLAARKHPEYLAKCGGSYSSEWFWSKLLRFVRTSDLPVHTWMELCDYVPFLLTGVEKRGICAAGHKAIYHRAWGGYPDAAFLSELDTRLERVRASLPDVCYPCGVACGEVNKEWLEKTGLAAGTPVSVGGIDAHLGAVGAGIRPGLVVKILGTSSCDMAVWPLDEKLDDIPGISGIVPESILPDMYGTEAGQAAVGDLFAWFVQNFGGGSYAELEREASALRPGQSGLIALDWNNGNRCTLADSRLSGLLMGCSLATESHEVYRALLEATAFGAKIILDRLEEYGLRCEEIVACGGIAEKSGLMLQIYADVTGKVIRVSRSSETCALGAAICGAVAGNGFPDFEAAQKRLCGVMPQAYFPQPDAQKTYDALYRIYVRLFEYFGKGRDMKDLLDIRDRSRA